MLVMVTAAGLCDAADVAVAVAVAAAHATCSCCAMTVLSRWGSSGFVTVANRAAAGAGVLRMLLASCRVTAKVSTSYLAALGGAGMLILKCTGKGSAAAGVLSCRCCAGTLLAPFLSLSCGYCCLRATRSACGTCSAWSEVYSGAMHEGRMHAPGYW